MEQTVQIELDTIQYPLDQFELLINTKRTLDFLVAGVMAGEFEPEFDGIIDITTIHPANAIYTIKNIYIDTYGPAMLIEWLPYHPIASKIIKEDMVQKDMVRFVPRILANRNRPDGNNDVLITVDCRSNMSLRELLIKDQQTAAARPLYESLDSDTDYLNVFINLDLPNAKIMAMAGDPSSGINKNLKAGTLLGLYNSFYEVPGYIQIDSELFTNLTGIVSSRPAFQILDIIRRRKSVGVESDYIQIKVKWLDPELRDKFHEDPSQYKILPRYLGGRDLVTFDLCDNA